MRFGGLRVGRFEPDSTRGMAHAVPGEPAAPRAVLVSLPHGVPADELLVRQARDGRLHGVGRGTPGRALPTDAALPHHRLGRDPERVRHRRSVLPAPVAARRALVGFDQSGTAFDANFFGGENTEVGVRRRGKARGVRGRKHAVRGYRPGEQSHEHARGVARSVGGAWRTRGGRGRERDSVCENVIHAERVVRNPPSGREAPAEGQRLPVARGGRHEDAGVQREPALGLRVRGAGHLRDWLGGGVHRVFARRA